MSNIHHFPVADRRQSVKDEAKSWPSVSDYLCEHCDINTDPVKDGLYRTADLVRLCKFLMESAANARAKGDMSRFQHFDDAAWEVRSMDRAVTDILYAEGFLQRHGVV